MDPARDLPLGRIRGLRACASARGTFGVLALDHRQNLRRELRPGRPGRRSRSRRWSPSSGRSSASSVRPATGVLLDPEIGAAQALVDGSLPAGCGLLVAIEATGYDGPSTARVSRVLDGWSVAKAKRIGASAAKLLVYYHPDAANAADQERLVATVAADCAAARPAAVRRAAVVLDRPGGPAADRRGAPAGRGRDRPAADRARRRHPEGRVPLRSRRDRRGTLARGLCRARRGLAAALGPPVGRGRRRDVRGPGPGRLRRRRERRPRRALGLGRGGDARRRPSATRSSRTTGRDRLARLVDLVDELGRPWDARPGPLVPPPEPAEGWYRGYAG